MHNWIWIGKFVIVIVAALVLGEVLGSLALFKSTTLGTPKVTAGSLVRFFAHAGALARLADPVLALITLIVTASAYVVLINFSVPFVGEGIRTIPDWTFILGILAAAVWRVWALFQNSEAVMEAIGKSGRTKTE
jgi:hypothetical protein